jgi:hypothetical protein
MLRNTVRASPGGLSRWPRILFLGTVALGCAVLVGLGVYGLAVHKQVSPNAAGTLLLGILTLGPGCILAWLASQGEANPWRTTGIWVSVLSYMGGIAALTLGLIGDAISKVDWWPSVGGLDMLAPGSPMPAGLVDSVAGTLWGTGLVLAWLTLPLFVPAGLYTLWAYWQRPHRDPGALLAADERSRRMASGFEVGAAVAATLIAALALVDAVYFHYGYPPSSPMPVWSEGGRVAAVGGLLGITAAQVAVGTALHLRGGRGARRGQVLLWTGALVLTVAGVLDSCSGTSLSGTTGTYAASTTGDYNGSVLMHWVGLGTFLLPAGVLALLLATSVTNRHPARHGHVPRYHRHTPTISTT